MSESSGGRHSSQSQVAFYRSAALWFLPWVIVAVVALGAVWIAVDALRNEVQPEAAAPSGDNAPAVVDATPTKDVDDNSEEVPEPEETETPKPEKEKKDKPELITDGILVQVLNGTADDSLDDVWADKLEGLGFKIEAVNPYHSTSETVVYWSTEEAREAAEVLADRFGWRAEPKLEELSDEVSLHVYLGKDED